METWNVVSSQYLAHVTHISYCWVIHTKTPQIGFHTLAHNLSLVVYFGVLFEDKKSIEDLL